MISDGFFLTALRFDSGTLSPTLCTIACLHVLITAQLILHPASIANTLYHVFSEVRLPQPSLLSTMRILYA